MMIRRDPEDPRCAAVQLRRTLVAAGWTDRMLVTATRDGRFAKARRGAYVDGQAWRSLDALGRHELTARAVVTQATRPVVISHSSGLPFHDSPGWGLDLDTVHVTSKDGSAGRAEAGKRHHRGTIEAGDVWTTSVGVEVMSPTRLALELTTIADTEVSVVHLNDLLHRGLVTPQGLRSRYEGAMERWPHSLATDLALRLADGRCESVAESRFFVLCWRQGLPAPQPQYPVRDHRGRIVARADFAWPEHGVFLEVDGRAKYLKMLREGQTTADAVLAEKARENLMRRLTGWRCLRIEWADLERPERTARFVRDELFPGVAA